MSPPVSPAASSSSLSLCLPHRDIITVKLDTNRGRLSFSKNDAPVGIVENVTQVGPFPARRVESDVRERRTHDLARLRVCLVVS